MQFFSNVKKLRICISFEYSFANKRLNFYVSDHSIDLFYLIHFEDYAAMIQSTKMSVSLILSRVHGLRVSRRKEKKKRRKIGVLVMKLSRNPSDSLRAQHNGVSRRKTWVITHEEL